MLHDTTDKKIRYMGAVHSALLVIHAAYITMLFYRLVVGLPISLDSIDLIVIDAIYCALTVIVLGPLAITGGVAAFCLCKMILRGEISAANLFATFIGAWIVAYVVLLDCIIPGYDAAVVIKCNTELDYID